MVRKENLIQKIKEFPSRAGVYLMKDQRQKVIYVGKAKNIKKRVQSYFSGEKDIKTKILLRKVNDIDTIITRNEFEALILELNLVKKHKPKYNINLKDGKTYPVIRITSEEYPRIFRTRRIIFDGSSYFGPFPSAEQIDIYLSLIKKLYPLRKCKTRFRKRRHPCIYSHIELCMSPCTGAISKDDYLKLTEKIKKLLRGESKELVKEIKGKMIEASLNLEYEKAAKFRDQLNAIIQVTEMQKVASSGKKANDYLGIATRDDFASLVVLKMRNGKLIGKEVFKTKLYLPSQEALSQLVLQYYSYKGQFPETVYLPPLLNPDLVFTLSRISGKPLKVAFPKRGKHASVINMACVNAEQDLRITAVDAILELKRILDLTKIPERIEGFDIAHLSGTHTVASMVCFLQGRPDKKSYRRFKIKTLNEKVDDYEAMREVIARRYTRVLNNDLPQPDLILIDGGKGQLQAAREILTTLGLEKIPIIGLAKKKEEIFLAHKEKPLILTQGSPALKILQAVRDESHRFATTFHKKLRDKEIATSFLERIKGIGKTKAKLLLTHFGSLHAIKDALPADIAEIAHLSSKNLEALLNEFKEI